MKQTPTARLKSRPQDPLLLDLINERQLLIRTHNDSFRKTFSGGEIHLSPEIQALCLEDQANILERIRTYQGFNRFSDPERLHNRGRFEYNDLSILWEIHCFDNELNDESPDPANPELTRRYLLVMLSHETDLPEMPKKGKL